VALLYGGKFKIVEEKKAKKFVKSMLSMLVFLLVAQFL